MHLDLRVAGGELRPARDQARGVPADGLAAPALAPGRRPRAAEAHALGLVHAVAADPAEACRAHLEAHVLGRSASALRFAERAARLRLVRRLHDDLPALERLYLDELMATPDANEGIAAFIERRPPRFEEPRP